MAAAGAETPIVTRSNPQQYLFRFELTVENKSELQQIFSVIMPHSESGNYQDIEYRELSGEVVAMADGKGNVIDTLVTLGPKEKKTIVNEFVATVYDAHADFSKIDGIYPYNKESDIYKRYTGVELPHVDPGEAGVKGIHEKLSAAVKDDLEYARAAFDYVMDNISYYRAGVYSVAAVVKRKSGSCVDQSGLFVSLLRCRGIPARLLSGYRVTGGTHARAEFYLEKYGWIPADIGFGTSKKESRLFGKSVSDTFASTVTQVYSGHVYLPADEFSFVTPKINAAMVPIKAYAGSSVGVKGTKGTITKLDNGVPVGEPKKIPL